MDSDLRIDRVQTEADRRAFLALPFWLYRDDPNWIPRLWSEQMAWLRREHGFFEYGDADWFIARRDGQAVGTIGVSIDHNYNQHLDRQWGIFGFFEFIEDKVVFDALVDRAQAWLRTRGMAHMVGPQSFTPNDFPGFLVGRYDLPPALYEGHSPPYYLAFAERAGWGKYQDSIAYRFVREDTDEKAGFMPNRIARLAERVARNPRFSTRHADLAHLDRELGHVLRLYNRALSCLPNFAPITEAEFRKLAEELKPALDEELVIFALADGQEVGFALALPNLAEAFQKCGGLRYPWQYVPLWWHARQIKSVSFKILAMDPDYWGRGLDLLMYKRLADVSARRGYQWADLSLTGDDNPQTNKLAAKVGCQEYKRYRIFVVNV